MDHVFITLQELKPCRTIADEDRSTLHGEFLRGNDHRLNGSARLICRTDTVRNEARLSKRPQQVIQTLGGKRRSRGTISDGS